MEFDYVRSKYGGPSHSRHLVRARFRYPSFGNNFLSDIFSTEIRFRMFKNKNCDNKEILIQKLKGRHKFFGSSICFDLLTQNKNQKIKFKCFAFNLLSQYNTF